MVVLEGINTVTIISVETVIARNPNKTKLINMNPATKVGAKSVFGSILMQLIVFLCIQSKTHSQHENHLKPLILGNAFIDHALNAYISVKIM